MSDEPAAIAQRYARRRVVRLHPCAWALFNVLLHLRSHRLAWVEKPLEAAAPGPAAPR